MEAWEVWGEVWGEVLEGVCSSVGLIPILHVFVLPVVNYFALGHGKTIRQEGILSLGRRIRGEIVLCGEIVH